MADTKSFYFIPHAVHEHKGADEDEATIEMTRTGGLQTEPSLEVEQTVSDWLSGLFRPKGYHPIPGKKLRKAPTKIEPKVFFANERTFLAWLHMSVTLSSISIAIVAFAEANDMSQLYGLMLMPVAIAFCAYSLFMYTKRASMIRHKHPGPYEDKIGPMVLAGMLGCAILVNFIVNLYDVSKLEGRKTH